ncbi:unnamed protein product [Discosporangium mesarthrocarpum]
MERKATREKRRREEVNEKFEQLLMVLEAAEASTGLCSASNSSGAPPPFPSSASMRRVEVLSRTITLIKKLVARRSQGACPTSVQHQPQGATSAPEESPMAAPLTTASPSPFAVTPPLQLPTQPLQSAGVPSSLQGGTTAVTSASPQQLLDLAAAAYSGAGPGQQLPGQPFFIAVPMFVPNPGTTAATVAAGGDVGPQIGVGAVNSVLGGQMPATMPTSGPPDGCVSKSEEGLEQPVSAPEPNHMAEALKAPLPMAGPGVLKGLGIITSEAMAAVDVATLPLPPFVAQAISGTGEDEEVTHAVCA